MIIREISITLRCSGRACTRCRKGRCWATYPHMGSILVGGVLSSRKTAEQWLRAEAQKKGWEIGPKGDFCPDCVRGRHKQEVR